VLLGDRGSRWRCLLVWGSGTSTLGLVVALLLPDTAELWRSSPADLPFDLLLRHVSSVLVLGCAAWAWLGLTGTVGEAWRGAPVRSRGPWRLPAGVRRLLLAGCGVALASVTVAPAHADPGRGHHRAAGVGALSGLPLPERAVAPRRPAPPEHRSQPHIVTVGPGDTLWGIAARGLPDRSPAVVVAARWHAIYAANRHLIGPDPDVIEPGQRLHLPPPPTTPSRKDRP
jgi:hypothetical protein